MTSIGDDLVGDIVEESMKWFLSGFPSRKTFVTIIGQEGTLMSNKGLKHILLRCSSLRRRR